MDGYYSGVATAECITVRHKAVDEGSGELSRLEYALPDGVRVSAPDGVQSPSLGAG